MPMPKVLNNAQGVGAAAPKNRNRHALGLLNGSVMMKTYAAHLNFRLKL